MKKTSSIYIPHLGCKNNCIFCNQVKITGKDKFETFDFKEMKEQILRDFQSIDHKYQVDTYEVAFFGGTFTALPFDIQEGALNIVQELRNEFKNKNIIIKMSTRPDAIDINEMERLKKYNIHTIELGVQTMDDEVLDFAKRGHNSQIVYSASELIKQYNINLGIQLMVGLPKDNESKFKETVNKILKIKPDVVRLYPVLVIENTYLATLYQKGLYKPLTINEAVDLSKYAYKKFTENGIKVIRIGLQPTDLINESSTTVLAGPMHSAFGELVESAVIKDEIETYIISHNLKNCDLNIYSNEKYISKISGNKKSNKIYFKSKYNINLKINKSLKNTLKIENSNIKIFNNIK